MVDTIKFKIYVEEHTLNSLQLTSDVQKYNQQVLTFFKYSLQLPSWYRSVAIFPDQFHSSYYKSGLDKYPIFVEFSVPKRIFNTNIIPINLSLTKSTVESTVAYIRQYFIDNKLGILPPLHEWILQRIDLCAMWDYKTYDDALSVFNSIVPFGRLVKNTSLYQNGLSRKFYLKQPEFMAHDYHDIAVYEHTHNGDTQLADKYRQQCAGYLRFEEAISGAKIVSRFGTTNFIKLMNYDPDFFNNLINTYILAFFGGKLPMNMTDAEALKILMDKYGYDEGIKLLKYQEMRQSMKQLLAQIPRLSRYRWNKKLKDAGVGFGVNTKIEFPTIKSKYLVIPTNISTCGL